MGSVMDTGVHLPHWIFASSAGGNHFNCDFICYLDINRRVGGNRITRRIIATFGPATRWPQLAVIRSLSDALCTAAGNIPDGRPSYDAGKTAVRRVSAAANMFELMIHQLAEADHAAAEFCARCRRGGGDLEILFARARSANRSHLAAVHPTSQ